MSRLLLREQGGQLMARHDRTGELIDDADTDTLPPPYRGHDPRCRDGWLGEDPDGRIRPCLTCRPHLAHRDERLRHQLQGPTP